MAPKLIFVVALGAAAFLAHKAKAGGDKPAAAPKKPETKSAPAKAASTKAAAAALARAASTKAAVAKPPLKNSAFVFVKPAANTAATQALVKEVFASKSIAITSEGEIDAAEIDAKKLIDQHYYAIASKATLTAPKDLPVPADSSRRSSASSGRRRSRRTSCATPRRRARASVATRTA